MVADDVDVVAGAAAVDLVCDHHLRSDHGNRRALLAGGMMQNRRWLTAVLARTLRAPEIAFHILG